MNITNFFKKFADTYKETFEREEKLLMEKQREQIDSLKVSVSMSENLNEKDLLELAHKYVTFVEDTPSHRVHWLSTEDTPSHRVHWLSTEDTPSHRVHEVSAEDTPRRRILTWETPEDTPKSYVQTWERSVPVKSHIRRKKAL